MSLIFYESSLATMKALYPYNVEEESSIFCKLSIHACKKIDINK